jgi:hypothetical protein
LKTLGFQTFRSGDPAAEPRGIRGIKIIAAGKGVLVKGSRAYFKSAKDPKDLVIITDATHCFDEIGKEEELLKETLSWVKKHALK